MSETSQWGESLSAEVAASPPAPGTFTPAAVGRYRPDARSASIGEVCRTLAAIAAATVRARDDATRPRATPAPSAGQRRDELARLRADARAAVTGLVFRLRADDVPLDRVLAIVRSAARDALPGSLTPAESRAIAGDAVRWSAEAYAVAD